MLAADIRTESRLGVAFAVSVSTHALLLIALGLSVRGLTPVFAPEPELWVQLVDAHQPPAAATAETPPSSAIQSAVAQPTHLGAQPPAQTETPAAKRAEAETLSSRSSQVSADNPSRPLNGRVDVTTTTTQARLGEALQNRAMSQFPPELSKPVRLASALTMDYPPAALKAGHEGSVLAWIDVDREGSVKEVEIAEGEPEFADSVRDSLMKEHFLAAEIGGEPVEHYIILQFDFRIGSRLVPVRTEDLGQQPIR